MTEVPSPVSIINTLSDSRRCLNTRTRQFRFRLRISVWLVYVGGAHLPVTRVEFQANGLELDSSVGMMIIQDALRRDAKRFNGM